MGWDQQGVADALRPKGETTRTPLVGLVMVTLANTGIAHHTSNATGERFEIFTKGEPAASSARALVVQDLTCWSQLPGMKPMWREQPKLAIDPTDSLSPDACQAMGICCTRSIT